MSELDKAVALMFPALKPAGSAAGQRRAAEAPGTGTPARAVSAPAPSEKQGPAARGEGRAVERAKRAPSLAPGGVEDPALVAELLEFVDGVGEGREVAERLPNPLHLGIVTRTGGTLRGQLRIYSIAGGKVGRVVFKDRMDERDQGPAVRERMAVWNRKQSIGGNRAPDTGHRDPQKASE